MWWGSMKERVRQRKRECLGGKDRKRNERADLSLHLGKQPPSAPWPTLLFPLSDTAVIYCSSRLIKQAFYVLRDKGGGFWKGEGCGNSRLNGEPSEDVNRRPWRHLPGPGSMALFSRLYWGSDVFGFHVLHPFFPLVLLLCAVLLFFMISSLLKDTCCESLVLAWGEWLTEWKMAFDVVWLDFITLSHKFDMKSVPSGWSHMDIGGQCQLGWWNHRKIIYL